MSVLLIPFHAFVSVTYFYNAPDLITVMLVHHNPFITLLLGSKRETMLAKQLCYIQTKMHRVSRIMTIYVHLST